MSEAKTEMNEEKNRGHPMNSTTILVSFGFPPRGRLQTIPLKRRRYRRVRKRGGQQVDNSGYGRGCDVSIFCDKECPLIRGRHESRERENGKGGCVCATYNS